ncbi:hypothetical protein [Campylobacter fetus]|uniref:hypothetical protein n=1 Tax=Campylobacter fetus TaxID=196 RepID=UPI000FCAF8CB|nr:hypothetical protein [Campylobacter fetus]RUT50965.1 hypothetical protein BWK67_00130 [Campylobacter fetus]RUT51693.1 hypothetical protein BWK51_00130 [Campylobacter fetus]
MQILTEKLYPYNIRSQSFSSTDLRKTKDDVGIVYPLTKGDNTPSFSSIVEHINDRTLLACGEYRIVSSKDEDVIYSKGRCINYIYKPDTFIRPSKAEALFDIPVKLIQESYLVSDELNASVDFITDMIEDFKDIDFTPEFIIEASNLSQKTYSEYFMDDECIAIEEIPKIELKSQWDKDEKDSSI